MSSRSRRREISGRMRCILRGGSLNDLLQCIAMVVRCSKKDWFQFDESGMKGLIGVGACQTYRRSLSFSISTSVILKFLELESAKISRSFGVLLSSG